MSKYTCTGKVIDICPNCKNCKTVDWDGVSNIECEDPFDGMVKNLTADSNVCCSMFEMRSDKSCDKISLLQHELEMDRLRRKIHELEKEKVAHMKGIERLKKSQEKLQNQIKNLQITNEESYKREEKLEDKVHKLERRLHGELERGRSIDTNFLMPLTRVLYPGEKVGKTYSEVLEDVKNLKIEAEEKAELKDKYEKLNTHYRYDEDIIKDIQDAISPGDNSIWSHSELVYEIKNLKANSDELKYWKERCHKAETDITTLNSKVEVLDKRNSNQSVMIGEKGKEIERLAKKNRELQIRVNDLLFQEKLNKSAFGYDYEEENGKLRVENEQLRNKNEKYLKKITDQQATHYKQCARILELETMVSKLQSGEYDDILAKDIEIKSLQAKYEDAMNGWKDAIDTNDKQIEEFTRRYNKIAKKLNDIHDILKKEENEDE